MVGSIGPGDDVEAWCTRCRMNLNHRVIAVVGSEIKRVHCLTCGGDHKYYPPKYAGRAPAETGPVRVAGGDRTRPARERAKAKAAGEWNTFMSEMAPGTEPRPYSIFEGFTESEYIKHPVFGVGRVLEVVGAEKIQVIFEEGRKVLVCNRRRA